MEHRERPEYDDTEYFIRFRARCLACGVEQQAFVTKALPTAQFDPRALPAIIADTERRLLILRDQMVASPPLCPMCRPPATLAVVV